MKLIDLLTQHSQIQQWQAQMQRSTRQLMMGLTESSKALIMASALESSAGKLVVVTPSQNDAEKLSLDLIGLLGEEQVYTFFTDDSPMAEFAFSSKDKSLTRVRTLNFLLETDARGILVINQAALQILLSPPAQYQAAQMSLSMGQEIEMEEVQKRLREAGYKKVSRVLSPGEYSHRGDILDIFETTSEWPTRLEFFGDEIDGMRIFDVETQTSLESVDQLAISPASEHILTRENFTHAVKKLDECLTTIDSEIQASYLSEVRADFTEEARHPDTQKFNSLLYDQVYTLFDYIPPHTPFLIDEFQKLMERHVQYERESAEYLTSDLQNGKSLSSLVYNQPCYQQLRQIKPATFFTSFQRGLGNLRLDNLYSFTQHSMQDFFSQIPLLKEEIRRLEMSDYTVLIQAQSESGLVNLQKTLEEYELQIPVSQPDDLTPGITQLVVGQLSSGFQWIDEKIALITEREIFHKRVKRKIRRTNISNAERLKDYNELEIGDFVVHQVHGIGKYLGIETIEIQGVHRDYLTIQYQNSDRISLPVEQIDILSKYIAADGKRPKLNKLNDGRFQKTKQKVQKQVEDMADELIELYAERSQLKGFAFSPDDANQEEFDHHFPYVETQDQLRSIQEVKADMEKERPMDRLLVGDVGFGKTEVAMRAAFKAVNDGKQVAILVPTTVLAQQHYENFIERFSDFPIQVEMLSRFRTKSQQTETLEKLRKGQVDILIGTHRILSEDVVFQDLGLLVIDEEQRFGVKHKEKMKELKKKIDVLTLTATPIPRTLHMSMLGIRDLSVIETPPTNRFPVQTYVLETNPSLIRDAVLREMDRDGQVYYLYNKVDTIEQKVSELRDLIPEASIGYVHGRMSEIQLENTLYSFIQGEYDILVTTTIIETGVDIPNANTLFIENADHMGLSTLYQLRGRVGRSNRVAYAYLMYRPDKTLTEVSEKRLEAIKGFTELGSGFKIAMQDLSIRGAGNLLGAAQSGFIDSIGYELYSQLLEEAVLKKQGKTKKREKSNAEVNLRIDAYLPSDYISDQRQKIEIYKRIRELDSRETYQELQDELIDRFGEYPDVVAYLIEIGLLKSFADEVFTSSLIRNDSQVVVTFERAAGQYFLTQDYFEGLSATGLKASISEKEGHFQVIFNVHRIKDYQILEELMAFFSHLKEIKERKEK